MGKQPTRKELLQSIQTMASFLETWRDCLAGVQMRDDQFDADSGLAKAQSVLDRAKESG